MFGIKINRVARFTFDNRFLEWNDKNGFYGSTDHPMGLYDTMEEARAVFPELVRKYIYSIGIVDMDGNVLETLSLPFIKQPMQEKKKKSLFTISLG